MGVEPNWKGKYPCPQCCAPTYIHTQKSFQKVYQAKDSVKGVLLFIGTVQQCRCSLNEFPTQSVSVKQLCRLHQKNRKGAPGFDLEQQPWQKHRERWLYFLKGVSLGDIAYWQLHRTMYSDAMQKCANILCTTQPLWRSEMLLPEIVITGKYAVTRWSILIVPLQRTRTGN